MGAVNIRPLLNRGRVSRRGFLASLVTGAAGVALAACTSSGDGGPSPSASTTPNPDDQARTASEDAVRTLLVSYAAAAAAFPTLAARLAPYVSRHEQHLSALQPKQPSKSASPSATPTMLGNADGAVASLAAAEAAAAEAQLAGLAAVSGGMARLLAGIAACEAAHAALLRAGK